MDLFYEPHRLLLKKLLDFEVEFILIGGYAVNYHGFSRPTGDIDLWLKPTDTNKDKLLLVLETYHFTQESIDNFKTIDFSKPEVFCMGEIPIRVDFLTQITGVSYEEADKEKIIGNIDGMNIPVLHLNHLVLSKITNNRTKDKFDVEELQKIQKLKPL